MARTRVMISSMFISRLIYSTGISSTARFKAMLRDKPVLPTPVLAAIQFTSLNLFIYLSSNGNPV
jgi:hypothetical protein